MIKSVKIFGGGCTFRRFSNRTTLTSQSTKSKGGAVY